MSKSNTESPNFSHLARQFALSLGGVLLLAIALRFGAKHFPQAIVVTFLAFVIGSTFYVAGQLLESFWGFVGRLGRPHSNPQVAPADVEAIDGSR